MTNVHESHGVNFGLISLLTQSKIGYHLYFFRAETYLRTPCKSNFVRSMFEGVNPKPERIDKWNALEKMSKE